MEMVNSTHILEISRGDFNYILSNGIKTKRLKIVNKNLYLENDKDLNDPFKLFTEDSRIAIVDRIADYLMDNEDNESLCLFLESIEKDERQSCLNDFFNSNSLPCVGTINTIKESIFEHFKDYNDSEIIFEYEKYLAERIKL